MTRAAPGLLRPAPAQDRVRTPTFTHRTEARRGTALARRGYGIVLIVLGGLSQRLGAQQDSTPLHGTVYGWSERTWLYVLDRGAADGGRLGDRGWLVRFHPDIDDEYAVDVISFRPALSDEYRWQRAENGVRYAGGSINHRFLVSDLTVKTRVGLGRGWSARFRFDKEDRPGIARNLPRIGIEKRWTAGAMVFLDGTVLADKPEMDMTLGGGWRDRYGAVTLSVTALDAFSQVIYQGLDVDRAFADTALDYERRPWALRLAGDRNLGPHVRVELDVGAALPATVRAYRQEAPDTGFVQDEQLEMAAGLVEWTTFASLRAGMMGTWVRAVTDRVPLAGDVPGGSFRLREETTQLGGYVLWRPWPRWQLESWLLREVRPETRVSGDGASDVDYEDRAWRGQTLVRYLASFGLKAEAALELDLRDVTRGDGQVPSVEGSVGRRNTRLRLELGWRRAGTFWIEAGYRLDLDGDPGTGHGSFDGAHARAVLFW